MQPTINVAFKASNGKYVTIADGTGVLQATSDTLGNAATFQMSDQGDNVIAFRAPNGKYVTNQQNGAAPLAALSGGVAASETFVLYDWGGNDNQIVLFASNQKYVKLVPEANDVLQAQSDDLSNADAFDLVPIANDGAPLPDAKRTDAAAQAVLAAAVASNVVGNPTVYTVCFSGTGCTRDEGEVSRSDSDKAMYCGKSGYIPIRIHKEISGSLHATQPSVSIRGVGENDWAVPRNNSEPLQFNSPLNADKSLLDYVKSYSGGDQYSKVTQINGWSAPALALHAANLAVASGKQQFNFIGHSRGAVEAIMAAWFIYAYGSDNQKRIPINIFAIDPVPGTGQWYGILTQLPPNVVSYVGVYAWDMCVQPADRPYTALVPRPNGLMTGKNNSAKLYNSWWPWDKWKYIADAAQLTDPLAPGKDPQPQGYELYACRGRHSTVAGNATSNGGYNPADVSDDVARVPELIYKMARGYLTQWGTVFPAASAVSDRVLALRQGINTFHRDFDKMGGGETRTSSLPGRPYVRLISSIYGVNPYNTYYMDNAVGDPPYKMDYPVTADRTDAGWVKWKFL